MKELDLDPLRVVDRINEIEDLLKSRGPKTKTETINSNQTSRVKLLSFLINPIVSGEIIVSSEDEDGIYGFNEMVDALEYYGVEKVEIERFRLMFSEQSQQTMTNLKKKIASQIFNKK